MELSGLISTTLHSQITSTSLLRNAELLMNTMMDLAGKEGHSKTSSQMIQCSILFH